MSLSEQANQEDTMTTTTAPAARFITIYTPGARTLADTTPYLVDGQPVTVYLSNTDITVFVGDDARHTAPRPKNLGESIAAIADYAIEILTSEQAVQVGVNRVSDDILNITLRANTALSSKNFGRKAAAAARRYAHGRRVVRISSGGAFCNGEQFHNYVYAIAD
jgi:hypothetical protein